MSDCLQACFLTRGDLYVSWEKGRDVFDRLLIDGDPAINSGNWMWLSASSFFYQYFRVYSPITYGKKYDPEGKFVRHFLPVLKVRALQFFGLLPDVSSALPARLCQFSGVLRPLPA